jgi:hypothetical protein
VARLLVTEHGPEDVTCVFCDTLTEDPDLYRFLTETIKYLECGFVHLQDGRNIWQVFNDVKFMGNSRVDPCSRILKREPFAKYLTGHDSSTTTLYYGIGRHEAHRIEAIRARWSPFLVFAPLIALGTTKENILGVLDRIGIEPPSLYELGFEHNNCGGFCVKTGQRQMLRLLTTMPDRYAWHEAEQERLFAEIGSHGFIRKTDNGVMQYLSLREFRELAQAGCPIQLYQDGACACFA